MLDVFEWPAGAGITALLLSGAAVLWFVLYRRHRRQEALRVMRAHSEWPITVRELVSADEHVVWHWLREAFADRHVMLKIPMVRYTSPTTIAESRVWHKRLSGVFCTFTVCGSDGTVIGCVDIGGPGDLDKTNCYLKESVLEKCGIPYRTVRSSSLPTAQELRAAFIGQIELTEINPTKPAAMDALEPVTKDSLELTSVSPLDPALIAHARSHLKARLELKRKTRSTGAGPQAPLFDQPADEPAASFSPR